MAKEEPGDPQFFTQRVSNKEFTSDRATLIARKVQWTHYPSSWLYLDKDRYVIIFGPDNGRDAEIVSAEKALDLYNVIGADRVVPDIVAFPTSVTGSERQPKHYR